MIIDARSLPENTELEADICIVGGGAAGITLAMELRDTGIKVVLLEGGDLGYDERSQSIYAGPNIGLQGDTPEESRLRMWGGSTNHWAGNCGRLEAIDFEAREGIPYSGWPFGRDALDPFYLRAQTYVEGPTDGFFDRDGRVEEMGQTTVPFMDDRLTSVVYAESPPTNFGVTYEDALRAAPNIAVYYLASALNIEANETASEVTEIRCADIDGKAFSVQARHYVLAMGGIEIPRLLLLSNNVATAGLGNQNDLVGRFFMDHRSIRPSLTAMVEDRIRDFDLYTQAHASGEGYVSAYVGASEKLLRDEQLPNFLFFLFEQTRTSPGQQSATNLKRNLARGQVPDNLMMHLGNVLTDMDGATNAVAGSLTGSTRPLIPRAFLDPWVVIESIPNPDSRVTLADTLDPVFGQRQVAFDWQMDEGDLRTTIRATEILGMELGRLGYGRIWSETLYDDSRYSGSFVAHGKHHCGTARMSTDPKTGVVDADCLIHGMSNLHVAGSAVFPTHGAVPPTFTIVAMTIRLADHLKARLAEGDL